jgi:LAS superfamily LD-carboxypeptidase LdcB
VSDESPAVSQWKASQPNGKIPLREMTELGPPEGIDGDLGTQPRMFPEAAFNYERMREAAKDDGVRVRIVFSYRTFDVQVDKDKAEKAGGNTAATPGFSNHGWGLALDLNLPDTMEAFTPEHHQELRWLRHNALERFGFDEDVDGEPWHWTYKGGFPIGEDEMTDEERAEFDEMKATIKSHERFIAALLKELGSEQQPARFEAGGKRVARAVRRTEE